MIFFIIAIGIYFTFIASVFNFANDKYNEKSQTLKEFVGDTVILNKDTLFVVDYSTFNNTLTLSNGVEVGSEFMLTLPKMEK